MRWLAILLGSLLTVAFPSAAFADDGHVTPGDNDFNAVIEHVSPGDVSGGSPDHANEGSDGATTALVHPCGEHQPCGDNLRCEADAASPMGGTLVFDDGGPLLNLGWCDPAGTAAPPQITQALVLRALRKVDLPASELKVQPPGGETLVNFRTNFFTDQGAFTRSVRLLGRRVDLKIWPSRFRWRFGDGAELASSEAGAPYPDLEITHAYESKGRVSPSVDTTYAAQFRVDGGPWRDVDGTVTIAGSPVGLRVRTARPVLVSYH